LFTAYERADRSKDAAARVHDTIEEVGISIFMTTATSFTAFALGCISSIPAIRWLCLYAFSTIAIDFVYQITFFIALVVLDEERIKNRRRDCLICCKVVKPPEDEAIDATDTDPEDASTAEGHLVERILAWYADKLLVPWVKGLVLAGFAALFAFCAYNTSQQQLKFDFTSILPSDSYIISFTNDLSDYSERQGLSPYIYFRFVDQSDPIVHAQMKAFVTDIVSMDTISDPPFHFWLRDYYAYMAENEAALAGLDFNQTLHRFLDDPQYSDHGDSIIFDADGRIEASRTLVHMDNVQLTDIDDILNALRSQRQVSSEQTVNRNGGSWAFFTFDAMYSLWEFLSVTADELRLTTVIGVVAVSALSILFIPHWSGVVFLAPLTVVLYIDLMGFLQVAGVYINGMTYVALVMSIGLLVDYVMHITLRYYESAEVGREEKTKDALRTMGASVLLGGISTFLGVLPLLLSSSDVINTIFMTFIGVVTLGIAHGLILLPVLLSLFGPE